MEESNVFFLVNSSLSIQLDESLIVQPLLAIAVEILPEFFQVCSGR